MAMNSPVQQSFTVEGTPTPNNLTEQPKEFPSSRAPKQRNPSTFRPPGGRFLDFHQPLVQHLTMAIPNMRTNMFPQRTEPESAPLRASESPYGRRQAVPGSTQIQNNRTQRPQAQPPRAFHFLPTVQPNQALETGHRGNNMDRRRQQHHLRRKTRWQHRLSQSPNSQFEATLSVLLLSAAFEKYICQAGICRELEHALVSVSAAQTLGFQISQLPAARQFLSPWGRIRAQLHTALVIELLLEGNPRVEVGNIIVLEDRFFSEHDLKVPLILGRAFCNNHLGGNLQQPALVPLGQTQNWFQIASASSDNSVGDFRSPVTPVTPVFYPMNNQSQILGLTQIPQPQMCPGLMDHYQTPPPPSMQQFSENFPADDSNAPLSPHYSAQVGHFPADAGFMPEGYNGSGFNHGDNNGCGWSPS